MQVSEKSNFYNAEKGGFSGLVTQESSAERNAVGKQKFNMRNAVPLSGTGMLQMRQKTVANSDNGQPHAEMLH